MVSTCAGAYLNAYRHIRTAHKAVKLEHKSMVSTTVVEDVEQK